MDPYAASILFLIALQNVMVLGRLYVRIFLVRNFGWDDVALIFALVVADAYESCADAIIIIDKDETIYEMPVSEILSLGRVTISSLCLYVWATWAMKLALAALLLRVLKDRWQRVTIYVVLTIFTVYSLVFFFIVLFECGNPTTFPYKIAFGQCLTVGAIEGISYAHGILSAGADIIMGSMPVIFVIRSNLGTRDKISVGCILVVGCVGCVTSIVRIPWVHYLANATYSWYISARGITVMSVAEISIGLTCISLATYKPLFRRLFKMHDRKYYYYSNDRTCEMDNAMPIPMTGAPTARHSRFGSKSPEDGLGSKSPQNRGSRIGNYRVSKLMRFNYPHAAFPANAYSVGVIGGLGGVGMAEGGSEPSLEQPKAAADTSAGVSSESSRTQLDGDDTNANDLEKAVGLTQPSAPLQGYETHLDSDSDADGMFSAGPLVTGDWRTQHHAHSSASSARHSRGTSRDASRDVPPTAERVQYVTPGRGRQGRTSPAVGASAGPGRASPGSLPGRASPGGVGRARASTNESLPISLSRPGMDPAHIV